MGLDMYLEKYPKVGVEVKTIHAVEGFARWVKSDEKCSFEDWCGYTADDLPDVNTLVSLLEMLETKYSVWDDKKQFPNEQIYEQVGYWRKANAIHKWFVENVQDNIDDCDYHRPVTKEDLETLFDMCREVLADHSKAGELLPSQSGFFFGSQQYDEWYFKDIEYTADLCSRLINEFDFDNYDLYYCSSW